uniref:Uncharacterized protein n=1 Tax=Anguilla anguilla TaxID=7936 RepID=A0A0E9UPR0_ANGAN
MRFKKQTTKKNILSTCPNHKTCM